MTQARLSIQRHPKIPHHHYHIEVLPPLLVPTQLSHQEKELIINTHQPLHTISLFINCTTYGRRLRSSQHEKTKKEDRQGGKTCWKFEVW
jgi:hypothetical protein